MIYVSIRRNAAGGLYITFRYGGTKMADEPGTPNINSSYVVFNAKGGATPVNVTETFWQDLTNRFGDFSGHLLVSHFSFEKDWDNWEVHPHGDELVCLLSGDVDFILALDSGQRTLRLNTPGSFVIVPRATWHTAKVRSPSSALFVTPGQGTETRPAGSRDTRQGDQPDAGNKPADIAAKSAPQAHETSHAVPALTQLNIVAQDFDATIEFYRRLGVDVAEAPRSPDGIRHAKAKLPDGFLLELDNQVLARTYNAAWRRPAGSSRMLAGFTLPTRAAVDQRYAELIAAGYAGRQPPYDAFWGQRYAIVADPEGNDIGLMSPPDEARRRWPPAESPAP